MRAPELVMSLKKMKHVQLSGRSRVITCRRPGQSYADDLSAVVRDGISWVGNGERGA